MRSAPLPSYYYPPASILVITLAPFSTVVLALAHCPAAIARFMSAEHHTTVMAASGTVGVVDGTSAAHAPMDITDLPVTAIIQEVTESAIFPMVTAA